MALSEDHRAILELLLEQRQSYADISHALGLGEAEVRSRAASAIASLGAEELAGDDELVDLMLGQLGGADARATLERVTADRELLAEARRVAALLKLALPAAEVPELPREPVTGPNGGERGPGDADGERAEPGPLAGQEEDAAPGGPGAGRTVGPPPRRDADQPEAESRESDERAAEGRETEEPPVGGHEPEEPAAEPEPTTSPAAGEVGGEPDEPTTGRGHSESEGGEPAPGGATEHHRSEGAPAQAGPRLDRGQKRLLAALLGGTFVVAAIVVGLSGSFGGGDGTETAEEPPPAESAGMEEGSAAGGSQELIRADLAAQGQGGAEGAAIFGSVEDTPVLQVTAQGLEPTGDGERYHIWLYSGDDFALRVARVPVGQDGALSTQFELPVEVLRFVVDGRFQQVDISRAPERAVRRDERRSLQERRAPRHVGQSVLRGPITGPGVADPE